MVFAFIRNDIRLEDGLLFCRNAVHAGLIFSVPGTAQAVRCADISKIVHAARSTVIISEGSNPFTFTGNGYDG